MIPAIWQNVMRCKYFPVEEGFDISEQIDKAPLLRLEKALENAESLTSQTEALSGFST